MPVTESAGSVEAYNSGRPSARIVEASGSAKEARSCDPRGLCRSALCQNKHTGTDCPDSRKEN